MSLLDLDSLAAARKRAAARLAFFSDLKTADPLEAAGMAGVFIMGALGFNLHFRHALSPTSRAARSIELFGSPREPKDRRRHFQAPRNPLLGGGSIDRPDAIPQRDIDGGHDDRPEYRLNLGFVDDADDDERLAVWEDSQLVHALARARAIERFQ